MSFRVDVRYAFESGILLAVKWGIACALWLGTGYVFWVQVATVRAQAQRGDQAFTYLTTGQPGAEKFRLIDALAAKAPSSSLAPVPSPSPFPDGRVSR
jgi:hypothetical protein